MPREKNFWKSLRPKLAPFGFLQRVENRADVGTPDVAYCLRLPGQPAVTGWVELKRVDAWPRRGKVRTGVEQAQVDWHRDWAAAGGRSFIMVKVGQQILLFPGDAAADVVEASQAALEAMNLLMGDCGAVGIVRCLTQ